MEKMNVCLIGCGAAARTHSRVARSLGGSVRLLYASRSIEKALEYNRRYRGIGAFGGYEEACASRDVQAVIICTPPALHREHACLAARYRKPMLIEKPVTTSLDELDLIETAVKETDTICMVAENYFFKPLIRILKARLSGGDIGQPLFIELNRLNRNKIRGWRTDRELTGGGALLEGGIHWIHLMCGIGGEAEAVLAAKPGGQYQPVAPLEDGLEVLFRFRNGTVGKLLHSWNIRNRAGGLCLSKIFGTEGNIHFESNGVFVLTLGRRKRLQFPDPTDLMGYRSMLRHFLLCVREHDRPATNLQAAKRDLAIVEAAYRSLETERFEPAQEVHRSRI